VFEMLMPVTIAAEFVSIYVPASTSYVLL